MRTLILLFLIFGISLSAAKAQEKCSDYQVVLLEQGLELDSLSVIEESIRIVGDGFDSLRWSFDLNTNQIKIVFPNDFESSSIRICFRTFPFRWDQAVARRSLRVDYDSAARFYDNRVVDSEIFDFREELFPTTNLYKSGSLTRGISVGNTQNVFVNSALNLQLEGEIAENLRIRASITDQNVPFQPEGNTQQLQDFDNVLIELYNENFNLSAGDVVLQQRDSEFLRYYKNVQGLRFTSEYQANGWKASTQAFASVAKGKFASINVPPLEGVLGPYRLTGPNNERFIIVMANSERVFLDGKLLQRGFNADYVIDYNQAEITFTPSVLITQFSRIRVDFEYAERNFSRSIIGANHIQSKGNVDLYFNYYQERDNRNRPLFTEFSQEELSLLSSVGDQVQNAVIPRIDSVAYDPSKILYERITELDGAGVAFTYYRYSTDPAVAHFELAFSLVGNGNGDYRRVNQLANGTVFEYVPRVNGQPQGDYSILTQLPAPDSRRMLTVGTRIKLGEKEKIYSELAWSSRDRNLFSEIDDEDNQGLGWKVGLSSEGRKLNFLPEYTLHSGAEFEYNSTNFNFIDRFRYIEFDRDWGIDPTVVNATAAAERLFRADVSLEKDAFNRFDYQLYLRNRAEMLSGQQHKANWNTEIGNRIRLRNEFFLLKSDQDSIRSDWQRYLGEITYKSKALVPGYRYSLDRNAVIAVESDSVLGTAMNFQEHLIFLQNQDSLKTKFRLDAAWREDRAPFEGELETDTRAFTANARFQKQWQNHSLQSTFTYRTIEYIRRDLPEELTVMGKVDYLGSIAKNLIRSELSYALGNGRELQREYIFIPAPNGDGTHTWRDDNGDGIQQLNEFYLAINPEEKLYVKIFVPTDTYVQAYTTLLNYRLQAKFPASWQEEGGLKAWLAKFSNTSSLSVEKKVSSNNFLDRINPFIGSVDREDILSLRQVLRSSFFFNRASAKYGLDLSYFDSQIKQLLAGGFEDQIQKDWRINSRVNFGGLLTLRWVGSIGEKAASSDFLDNRNFIIKQLNTGPELAWQPSPSFRATATYSYTQKQNTSNLELDERAILHQTGMDFRLAKAIKTTLTANLKWIEIDYNGVVNSPVGYEMLQALTPGTNITWSLNWLQKIGEGLQMNLVYEGRNSQGLDRVVHVGRMQVSALF
ncbi:hypothetical protein KUV23_18125 [Algoriphagus marincola]|uniref:Cell surface protein SprA n=1 Tax=Algoriphagus marincola TaxID=264027 RepID=A0ABS7N9A0_9BACT|nr:hypothetical protein [Algoriphagus marincola]MBY5952904.1 hypothetical protein [Algoriphagus marincola]